MERWKSLQWAFGRIASDQSLMPTEPEPFTLPSPIPQWPQGGGFAHEKICIGELEVLKITKLQSVWSAICPNKKGKGAIFYTPIDIPDRYFCLGHYGQTNGKHLDGYILVAKEVAGMQKNILPALEKPVDYKLVWSSDDNNEIKNGRNTYFWLPCAPKGYKSVGFVVSLGPVKPSLDEVRCVRADLTDKCEVRHLLLERKSAYGKPPFRVWSTRPCHRGLHGKGVSIGTFFCSAENSFKDEFNIFCLKNFDTSLHAMPNVEQIHALIKHYGPTVFFHPEEIYLPSSVSWFFENGATLHKKGELHGVEIDSDGSNLPAGGRNDGEYWIDLPHDHKRKFVKHGNLATAELYVHAKPAFGGIFTDLAMWVFCPFNGPGTIKIGMANYPLSRTGQHVGDWEHFTLRISNFTGELLSIYYSQHSGGEWIDAPRLEFIEGNKAVVYSSKSGHASFPRPCIYLQGSQKLGIGIRNDAAISKFIVDSSAKYKLIAAEYLGSIVKEPPWLQYMREWGPTITYNSRSELDKITSYLPLSMRSTVERILSKLPLELYGEEGPTGPKEKNNWEGDERG